MANYYKMPYNNIDDVITALGLIVSDCRQQHSRTGYFAALYLRMTIAIKEGIAKGLFEDGKRMEQLDICFAARYTSALECYTNKQQCTQSWQYAFDCCAGEHNIVLQHLLLGINTHINLDLAIAAATIAPGAAINALENDFNQINNVIATLFDDVQASLSQIWLPMQLLTKIANGRQDAILNFSIEKARTASWANALLLANMNKARFDTYVRSLDHLVKQLALKIENPGAILNTMLSIIRQTEYDDPARTIDLITTVNT